MYLIVDVCQGCMSSDVCHEIGPYSCHSTYYDRSTWRSADCFAKVILSKQVR